ncbi:MAG: hypothetical protein QME60_01235 [Verrucomicrobiota bacterium]|nr:hypothetical protein [Verrucomicrobiota bacterium]
MPIPGFGDRVRLPRIGVIRLGEKVKNASGREYPRALDYFRLDDAPGVKEVYGNNPKELDVMFPTERVELFFEQKLKAYRKSGLFCASDDGHEARRVRLGISDGQFTKIPKGQPYDPDGEAYLKQTGEDVEVGSLFELPCPFEECGFFKSGFCKPVARLLIFLPKVPGFGVYQIVTSSDNGTRNINSYIESIRAVAGRVSMIPLKLRLEPMDVQVEGKKKTIHILTVKYEGSLQSLMALRRNPKLIEGPVAESAMPKPDPKDVPDDLYPNGGAALDAQLGKGKEPPKVNGDPATAARARLGQQQPPRQEELESDPLEVGDAQEQEGGGFDDQGSPIEPGKSVAPLVPARPVPQSVGAATAPKKRPWG